MIRRGTLHWARVDKRRPVLVVSPDYRNDLAADLIVVPCSTVRKESPTHVLLRRGEGGLSEPSVAKCEQVLTVRRTDVLTEAMGAALTGDRMDSVERALLRALGIGPRALRRHYLASLADGADSEDPRDVDRR